VVDNDLGWLDFYGDQVRHPALNLELFTASMPGVDDEIEDEDIADDVEPDRAVPTEEVEGARRRRGALLAAANLIFDRVVFELTVLAAGDELAEERFVDEYFPPQYRHLYENDFHRKILATIAKVSHDLVNPHAWRPACTAEELVLYAILREWQALLDVYELGQPWTDLTEDLFDDLDFENLYAQDMDGIENDPIAQLSTGMDVRAIADWFVPFNSDSVVHPYVVEPASDRGRLYDLTRTGDDSRLADPAAAIASDGPVRGLDPVSDLVEAARADARGQSNGIALWVPNDAEPDRSMTAVIEMSGTSGVLTFQAGPDRDTTEAAVLWFKPHPAHPATGQAWAEVMFMSGRIELPLAAVVSFRPDPTVRQRWETIFQTSGA
jgi:hypothetical protein